MLKDTFAAVLVSLAMGLAAAAAPLFDEDTPLAVTLTGPMKGLLSDDGEDRREWPFKMTVEGQEVDVKLKLRGNFRRANCNFAPIRLNVKKRTAKGTSFEGQDKLKLVTHCRKSPSFELNTLEEYNAYRIFNLITDASFRVRLLHVTYVGEKRAAETKYGFVIEDVDALAKRLDGKQFEPPKIGRDELDLAHATRAALFQYLIGNTDFSLIAALAGETCCHNAKLIAREGHKLLSVPYDFDMSGLVYAPYATPNPQFKIRSVRQRKYWGFCTDAPTLESAVADFADKRDHIERLFTGTPGMGAKEAARAMSYLEGFYKELGRDNGARFAKQCR